MQVICFGISIKVFNNSIEYLGLFSGTKASILDESKIVMSVLLYQWFDGQALLQQQGY